MDSPSTFEYSHIVLAGIDHNVIAELCSSKILNNPFAQSRYRDVKPNPQRKEILSKRIADVIRRSKFGINVVVSSLILIERFQESLITRHIPFSEEVEDAGHLFFTAYMVAAKVICDGHLFIWFWRQVSNYEYSGNDITRMEFQLYESVGWRVQIDAKTYNRELSDMKDAYQRFTECYKLPSAPKPVYQKLLRNQITRANTTKSKMVVEHSGSLANREDEGPLMQVLTYPPTAAARPTRRESRLSKYRLGFFRVVLQATHVR